MLGNNFIFYLERETVPQKRTPSRNRDYGSEYSIPRKAATKSQGKLGQSFQHTCHYAIGRDFNWPANTICK